MTDQDPVIKERQQASRPASSSDDHDTEGMTSDDYKRSFGEDLLTTLDIDSWATGLDWESAVARFAGEINSAVQQESRTRSIIRDEILPKINSMSRPNIPAEVGVYRAAAPELDDILGGLLFPGKVEAVDGTSVTFDSLPIGITQIGIAVVSYGGTSATFAQRIFRKEIPLKLGDAYDEVIEIIQQREKRSGVDHKDSLSDLARRGVMTFAERKIMVDKSQADWRIGHGNPVPYELLTGSGHMDLLDASIHVMRRLIQDHKKFVFVPSAPGERGLLTLGNALIPGEYIIFDSIESRSLSIVEKGHYSREYKNKAEQFVRECGPDVLLGLFRAAERAPPYMFYAHREYVHMAVRVAMADSILRPERGFPMLIDVADVTCRSAFGADGFHGLINDAYAKAGANLQYFGERDTRR